ncbi:hypothetical protein J6590_104852 [Homalodisca vitripennis]|nr:hypothetical protein J6590_104852 [Homalodisca vitripennis]
MDVQVSGSELLASFSASENFFAKEAFFSETVCFNGLRKTYITMDNWKGHRRFPGAGDPSSPSFGILKELRSTQADGKTTGERGPSSQMVTVRAEPLFIQATPVRIGPFKETPNLENNTGQWQTCSQKAKQKKRQADAVLTKSKETRNPNSPRGQKLSPPRGKLKTSKILIKRSQALILD